MFFTNDELQTFYRIVKLEHFLSSIKLHKMNCHILWSFISRHLVRHKPYTFCITFELEIELRLYLTMEQFNVNIDNLSMNALERDLLMQLCWSSVRLIRRSFSLRRLHGKSLNLVMVLVCGFFTILNSFEFGKERSNKWLLELCLSFVQNILIIQQIEVIIISLAIAAILRKIDNSFLDTVEHVEIEDEDKRFLDLCSFQDEVDSQPLIAPKPPSEKQ